MADRQMHMSSTSTCYISHTHNHFTALWTLSRTTQVSWYQKVHFAIFWIFWCKMKITQADTPTIRMDCHPIQTNWCSHLRHPHHFMPDALPGQFILAWERHQICRLAYPVAWFYCISMSNYLYLCSLYLCKLLLCYMCYKSMKL